MVIEVMGHEAGWIACYAGTAGGADVILIPELKVSIHAVCDTIMKRHEKGRDFSIVVVAEGATLVTEDHPEGRRVLQGTVEDEFGEVRMGGIGAVLGREIEARTGFETRVTILGHIQRGGTPTAADRVLATRFGVAAVDMAHAGDFGKMVALEGGLIKPVSLAVAAEGTKTVPEEIIEVAKAFFG
jgi:6-phosphofructokinase 1